MNPLNREDIYPMDSEETPFFEDRPLRTRLLNNHLPQPAKSLNVFYEFETFHNLESPLKKSICAQDVENPLMSPSAASDTQVSVYFLQKVSDLQEELSALQAQHSFLLAENKLAEKEAANTLELLKADHKSILNQKDESCQLEINKIITKSGLEIAELNKQNKKLLKTIALKDLQILKLTESINEQKANQLKRDKSQKEEISEIKSQSDLIIKELKKNNKQGKIEIQQLEGKLFDCAHNKYRFIKKVKENDPKDINEPLSSRRTIKPRSITPLKMKQNENIKLILKELRIQSLKEVLPTIRNLQSSADLIGKISRLITDCMPKDEFCTELTHKLIWKWFRKVMEDLIALKKEQAKVGEVKEIIDELQTILRVPTVSKIKGKVLELAEESKQLKKQLYTRY